MRTYSLKKQPGLPLYEALYRAIREDILSGTLQPGQRLPSKRTLAQNLEVGKTTVEAAYAQLLDEGYILSKEKVGYFVAAPARKPAAAALPAPVQTAPAGKLIDLTGGGTGHFPFTVWNRLQREMVLDLDKTLLEPLEPMGTVQLRRAIAKHLADFRGMQVQPENILVGAGTDFLYNILVQLLGREQVFAVEEPGYAKIRAVYTAGGARCVPLPVDAQGASDRIPREAGILHISPSHNYPTGVVMSSARREAMLEWAQRGHYIIEDDFDSEFRSSAHPKPALQSLEPERVIYMNSFSKSLAPSIRIGYLVLPAPLAEKFRRELGFYGCTVPSFEQYTLARFLDRGHFEKHINRMRRFYNTRRGELISRLEACNLCRRVHLQEQTAGLHFLLKLETALPDTVLEQELLSRGIRARTLSSYYSREETAVDHRLVVNYTGLTPEDFEKVLKALEEIL